MIVLHLIPLLLTSELLLPAQSEVPASGDSVTLSLHHATVISAEDLPDLIQSPSVSFVYFSANDSPKIQTFLQDYDRAAKYLEMYNVTLAVYNCTSSMSDHDFCKNEGADNNVYTFQNGAELLTLTLELMGDVNSIMTNALQLVLLHQVPLIQSELELQDLQKNALGRQNILFAYPTKFGSEDHRIFLEVAYNFHDHFQFALTTDVKVTHNLQQRSDYRENKSPFSMWVLFCAESTSTDDVKVSCRSVLYRDEISLTALASFIQRALEKNLYHAPDDGVSQVFELTDRLPIIFLYASKNKQAKLTSVIEFVKFDLRGYAKLVLVDMDNEECTTQAQQQGHSGRLPDVGIKQVVRNQPNYPPVHFPTPNVRSKTVHKVLDGVMTFLDKDTHWTFRNVQKFIRSLVLPGNHHHFETPESHQENSGFAYISSQDPVQRQDDLIAAAVYALHAEEMELDHVPAFMKHDFYNIVPHADLKFVLFYLPFDHISMAFLREFGHAAGILARNFSDTSVLAQVNCYDATDLCTAENITTYPVLRIYRKGQGHVIYKGALDAKSVIRAVKLWQLNGPVHLSSKEEVINFIKGEHPKPFHKFTPSSVILLASAEKSDEEHIFLNVSKNWSIIAAFGVVHGNVAKSTAKIYGAPVPSILAFHRSDRIKPIRILSENISELSLTNFVKNSVIHSVPKLTVMNLPTLFARKQPFVILFIDSSDPASKFAKEMFTQLAMIGQFDQIIFCWMDVHASSMGEIILSEYTLSATLPMITLVDHGKGEVFNYQPQLLMIEETVEWLSAALANKMRPSKMLQYARWGPPGPHYDFLAKMDKKEKGEKLKLRRQSEDETQENFRLPQKSNLHQQNLELQDDQRKAHLVKEESQMTHSHHHTEL